MKEKDPSQVSWKQMFLFTRNGSLQNADFMYAFFLGVGLLFINFIISNRLTILFEQLFPSFSRELKNFIDILIPSLFCVFIAWLLFRVIRKKKIVLTAYVITLITAVSFAVVMAVTYDRETIEVLLPSMIGIFVIPALAGTAAAAFLYRRWARKNPDPILEEMWELENRNEKRE